MKITVLGSGSPIPGRDRVQSGFLLKQGSNLVLVDCGAGILYRLQELKVDLRKVDNILLTHYHLDHMSDLLPLLAARWLLGSTETTVYGPEGTKDFLSSLLALFDYLNAAITLNVIELQDNQTWQVREMSLTTMKTRHLIANLAYKVNNKVVISGDSEPCPKMGNFSEGCDLLLHECSLPDALEVPGHSTPTKLGQALAGHAIKMLVLVHLYPSALSKSDKLVDQIQQWFSGKVEVAKDLDTFYVKV